MSHGSVIRHADDQRVFGDTQLSEIRHELADERIDNSLQTVLQHMPFRWGRFGLACGCCVLGVTDEFQGKTGEKTFGGVF